MRFLHLALVPALALSAPLSTRADAPPEAPRTLAGCAELLPSGQRYSFGITGVIDATGAAPVLSGEMVVDDGTELDRSSETAAFQQCVAALIR